MLTSTWDAMPPPTRTRLSSRCSVPTWSWASASDFRRASSRTFFERGVNGGDSLGVPPTRPIVCLRHLLACGLKGDAEGHEYLRHDALGLVNQPE